MKLKAYPPTPIYPKRIEVRNHEGDNIALVNCDSSIQWNGHIELYPSDIKQVLTIAENFNLFYQNIKEA
jgi:hypothetical protein